MTKQEKCHHCLGQGAIDPAETLEPAVSSHRTGTLKNRPFSTYLALFSLLRGQAYLASKAA
jgi:hypothetical protein